MHVFYNPVDLVQNVVGGFFGAPDIPNIPSPKKEAKKEAEAAEEARRKALTAAQQGTGRSQTLLAGSQSGGTGQNTLLGG